MKRPLDQHHNLQDLPPAHWTDPFAGYFLRIAASGWLPARWFLPDIPPEKSRAARSGKLKLEIVSHCWNYSHMLVYQLSSLVLYPPSRMHVTMTVYYSSQDRATQALLQHFDGILVPGVTWNWRELPKQALFRRAIGRNEAALASKADWVWFTDCDLLFRENCLDSLADALQNRRDALVFPRSEHCTALLAENSRLLRTNTGDDIEVRDIEPADFTLQERDRATGPLQITHGDVARASGYCNSLPFYLKPAEQWRKAHEDRAFRWLLGTRGVPVDIRGVYRIRHISKGRYTGTAFMTKVRGNIRRAAATLKRQ